MLPSQTGRAHSYQTGKFQPYQRVQERSRPREQYRPTDEIGRRVFSY